MTDKEELRIALHNKFHNICQIRVIEGGHQDVEIEKEVADFIYSYFQSKQQREDYEFTRKEIIEWLHEQNWKCEQLEKLLIRPKK